MKGLTYQNIRAKIEYQGLIGLENYDEGQGTFRDHDIPLQIPLKIAFCVNKTHHSSLREVLKGGGGVSHSMVRTVTAFDV
jgi:hypothetical protein